MSTYIAKQEEVTRKWYIVDASGKALGRLASNIAPYITGKIDPTYTPHVDAGNFVIVINASRVKLTGNKWEQKKYRHHSQYPGGLKEVPYTKLREENPELIIKNAVKGMLPKNKLGKRMIKRVKVYGGSEHPHEAQQPEKLEFN
ncbi:MAG: 50S ribosomal protein L13 [Halanaerobiaceae bacterium]